MNIYHKGLGLGVISSRQGELFTIKFRSGETHKVKSDSVKSVPDDLIEAIRETFPPVREKKAKKEKDIPLSKEKDTYGWQTCAIWLKSSPGMYVSKMRMSQGMLDVEFNDAFCVYGFGIHTGKDGELDLSFPSKVGSNGKRYWTFAINGGKQSAVFKELLGIVSEARKKEVE